jgi:hypothetical protein
VRAAFEAADSLWELQKEKQRQRLAANWAAEFALQRRKRFLTVVWFGATFVQNRSSYVSSWSIPGKKLDVTIHPATGVHGNNFVSG